MIFRYIEKEIFIISKQIKGFKSTKMIFVSPKLKKATNVIIYNHFYNYVLKYVFKFIFSFIYVKFENKRCDFAL